MSYYKILGFEREPFSTSPDPDFLYMSHGHEAALTHTLIELNLRRGLNVILGDIGTGKTTLSRKLVQELRKRDNFLFHMILNPDFENEKQFLYSLMKNFNIPVPEERDGREIVRFRDVLERFLLEKAMRDGRIVVLIIDEAQVLSAQMLESLRILLNYETNEFKLMQIVLLGQMELYARVTAIKNFYDRINFKYTLYPLDFDETRNMIRYRIKQAGYGGKFNLFLDEAVREIYSYTEGYPRRITFLCHNALKGMILKNKYVVDRALISDLIAEEGRMGWRRAETLQSGSY